MRSAFVPGRSNGGALMGALAVNALALSFAAQAAAANTYRVGPDRPYAHPSDVAGLLQPGDIVEIDGDATYPGGTAFWNAGAPDRKITVRGITKNGKRPVLSGGSNTVEAAGDHYVFENLEITGGGVRCFFHHAHDIEVQGTFIHDCPQHGLLGATDDSGSLLLDHVEFARCGAGIYDHQIYMDTDERTHPGAVFRLQHSYIHDGNGGNNVKSRALRNEIYSNWIEGAMYHEIELIGPASGRRKDSDVVGNVIVKKRPTFVARFGGDADGNGTGGRYRFVNNTVLVQPSGSAVFRLFAELESVEMHNNVFAVAGNGRIDLIDESHATWTDGSRIIAGSNNWVPSSADNVPPEWRGTLRGGEPGFSSTGALDLRPAPDSPLVDAGRAELLGAPGHEFPSPLARPLDEPVPEAEWPDTARERATSGPIDIGAFESAPKPDGSEDGGGPGGGDSGPGAGPTDPPATPPVAPPPTSDGATGGSGPRASGAGPTSPAIPAGCQTRAFHQNPTAAAGALLLALSLAAYRRRSAGAA